MAYSIKFSVFTITYNQEKYVSQMIDSVMNQFILPYEFIISDDCSTDKTWDIISEYQRKYPDIIKAYRQEKNVGIYKNQNFALTKITGDILCALGGDDFFEKDLFKNLADFIDQNKIDYKNESFIIVTNTAHYYPNGKITIWNNYRLRNKNIFKEQLRGGVSLRWIGYSTKLLPYMYAPDDMGFGADWYRNSILYYHCPKFYFADFVSTYYRVGVGVTSRMTIKDHYNQEKERDALQTFLEECKEKLDKKDVKYLKYQLFIQKYFRNQNIINWLTLFCLYLYNLDNFSVNNNFLKQLKIIFPFKAVLYKIRKILYKY